MFEFDFFKLIILAMIGLLVLGPEKLPALAARIGRWMGRARSVARQLQTQLEQEVRLEEDRQRRKEESARTPPPAHPADANQPAPASSAPPPHTDLGAEHEPDLTAHHDTVHHESPASAAATSVDSPSARSHE